MDEATKQALNSAARSILVMIGSGLVAKGYLTSGNWEIIGGIVTAMIPVIWGIVDKYLAERKTAVREAVAVNAGIALSNMTPAATPPIRSVEEAKSVIEHFSPAAQPTEGSKL